MQTDTRLIRLIVIALMLTAIGCNEDENKRLADMAEKNLDRQAEQNRQMSKLQHEVAQGTRLLVEADAEARQEIFALHREIQTERAEIGRQRDSLEDERRTIASQRYLAPIIAAAITNIGLLLISLLPLILCWYLLHSPTEPADDRAVAEILLEDLVASEPLLQSPIQTNRAIGFRDETDMQCLPNGSDGAGESA